ncbi:hypothetical protein HY745_08940 [Candidatus Desantisbacteria bacterium]|nr:hypothetical protein [Candidatus Desantisbacteria bacterium]
MSKIKKCPGCGEEYYEHIECCADCGEVLVYPDENGIIKQKGQQEVNNDSENSVIIRKGELDWIKVLSNILDNENIPCIILPESECNKGCCGNTYLLAVSEKDAERAIEVIEEYYMKIHPEIRNSKEFMKQGKCPGLPFIVVN